MISDTCDMHKEKKKKFCKETNCWERLCSICAHERHNSHNVVDYDIIITEVKAEREKHITSKGKVLIELKKALIHLEKINKEVKDERMKIKEKERKLKAQVESQMKALEETVTAQQFKAQKALNGAVEEINAKKFEVMKMITAIEKIAEQITVNGDGYSIHKFFELCSHNCSIQLENIMNQVIQQFNLLQGLQKKITANDFKSVIGNNSLPGTNTEQVKNNNKITKFDKNTALGNRLKVSSERVEIEYRLETLRKILKHVTDQVNEKKSLLQSLEALIVSKSRDVEVLKDKKGKLVRASNNLKEQVEIQNKAFENTTRGLCFTSRTFSNSPMNTKRSSLTPSNNTNNIKKEAPSLNLDLIQDSVRFW